MVLIEKLEDVSGVFSFSLLREIDDMVFRPSDFVVSREIESVEQLFDKYWSLESFDVLNIFQSFIISWAFLDCSNNLS